MGLHDSAMGLHELAMGLQDCAMRLQECQKVSPVPLTASTEGRSARGGVGRFPAILGQRRTLYQGTGRKR